MSEVKLYNGDCLIEMMKIEDNSVDAIICDLPYGMTAPTWDSVIDFDKLWEQYNRVISKNGVIALFGSQPFTTKLITSNNSNFKYCWYWVKNQGTNFLHAKRMPIRKVEEICIFGGNTYYPQKSIGHIPTNSAIGSSNGIAYHGNNVRNYIGGDTDRFPTNILTYKCVNNYSRLHSSEKPVDLLEYLVKTYTNENETVLDNCMGSGSVGIACMNTNRNFIGIELDENYFNISKNRLDSHHKSEKTKNNGVLQYVTNLTL